jgi:hypothetical protein
MNLTIYKFVLFTTCALLLAKCATQEVRAEGIYEENRYEVSTLRNADGFYTRSKKVAREFQKIHPCPSTGLQTGACPGWAKDHVIPRACGGIDAVWNMQWLPDDIKHSVGDHAKDSFERKIYSLPDLPLPNCKSVKVE